jgi:hypothetical protein
LACGIAAAPAIERFRETGTFDRDKDGGASG